MIAERFQKLAEGALFLPDAFRHKKPLDWRGFLCFRPGEVCS